MFIAVNQKPSVDTGGNERRKLQYVAPCLHDSAAPGGPGCCHVFFEIRKGTLHPNRLSSN